MSIFRRKIHIKRILKIAALAFVGGFTLLLILLALLPVFVSSHTAQIRIQQALSSSLKRQVVWSSLAMTWSEGLTLSGLKLGNGPAPLLKTDIDQIFIDPSVGRGTDGRIGINLVVKVRNVRAELAPGPQKPPPPPPTKDPLTMLAELIQKIQGLDFPLPVNVSVMIEVAPLQVGYLAPAPAKQLRLHDSSFNLSMPSLADKPVTAQLTGLISADGRDMGKISCRARVSDLATRERRIHLASALFDVEASAPGTSISLTGGLSQADGFTSRWKLNLPALLVVAHPFAPSNLPKLDGGVELLLQAKSDANRDLHATLTVDGTGLAASGGSLKAKKIGPLDVRLKQNIATDHKIQRVGFPDGKLAVTGLLDASWSAAVVRPSGRDRSLELQFGPLSLDLARALSVATPFLPPGAPVKDLAGEASLRSLSLKLAGPDNNGNLAAAGLRVKLPRLRLALKNGELTAEDTDLLLEKVECPLIAKLPISLNADLLWSLRRAVITGAQPLTILGGRGKVGAAVTDLNLKSSSPRKIAASVQLNQNIDLDRISLGTRLSIIKPHEQLRLLVRASENGDIEANLPEFAVTVDSLSGVQSGKRYGPVPLSASLVATGIHLPAVKGTKPALQRAAATVSVGEFLQLSTEASLSGSSPQRAANSGTARLDLRRAIPFAAPFVQSGLKADGVVSAVWNLAAPLPEKAVVTDKHPLRNARAGLSQFDKLEFGVKLDSISATVPSAKGTITVTGLRSKPDLRVISANRGESVRFEGGVQFSALNGLSGTSAKLPSQHGSFTFNGELSGWREFRLSEELRLDPIAVSQEGELNVSRIDSLLDEKEPFNMATLIKRLDATLITDFSGALSHELKPFLPGIDLAGNINSGVRVDLSAGRELALRCFFKTKDFGVQMANGTKVEDLRSDIEINRVYALAASKGESWLPLSTALVRPSAVVSANPGATEVAGRIHDDLRGNISGTRSFSIRRVTTKVAGVPLVLTALEGDLLFAQEKIGLSFFQADLLGGTLLASGVFDLSRDVPRVAVAGSLSNLDITYLLPAENRKRSGDQDAEITGEISFTAPLTAEQRELFEQLRLAVNLRKIGANTIERALFSLDPYERNEQLVAQRKMLRLGGLKGLRANAVDGAFSMEGEAHIKGVTVDLPKVERLRISELPLRQELARNRKGIMALRGILDLVRADTLVIGPKGELSLKRRMYEQ
ncbi:MAG: hypothetical protein HGB32_06135 [Geobacteraceae bacterium]|nr:hypothetical protein [Geobacteraceae bacterium]NTW79711.1 hypothetical protein [Geobacteraceae bacterium]